MTNDSPQPPTSTCVECGQTITFLPYLRGKRWLAGAPKPGPVCTDGWGHIPASPQGSL